MPTGSAEEGATEGTAAGHRAEPPLPASLHRMSGTARHPKGQVACPHLPQLQPGQGQLSPCRAIVGQGDTGRRWAVLHQHQPRSLGRLPLCPGSVAAPVEGGGSAGNSPLSPGPPRGAGAGALPCCPGISEARPDRPSAARSRGGH